MNWIQEHPEEMIKPTECFYGISDIHHILANKRDHMPNQIIDAIIAITPRKKEAMMTAAQQLEQKAYREAYRKV